MSNFDDLLTPPPGFVPIGEAEDKLREDRWDVNDESWNDWNFELLSDEALLKRYHDAAMELEAQAFRLTDDGQIVPREFTEEELTRARSLRNFWKAYCEVRVRSELREFMQSFLKEESHGKQR